MVIEKTNLEGCFVVTPKLFKDERGCFFESFNASEFERETGLVASFIQDNISKSAKGVLRGLHFQTGKFAQSKLVSVLKGKALDVCVDIRIGSPTFGQHFSVILDQENSKQVYIPKGFAHGFLALENDTIFSYKCDAYYNQKTESGIIFNDEILKIDWGISTEAIILSKKDKDLQTFKSFINEN